jgi:predicted GTPase
MPTQLPPDQNASMILVMGVTGSGKSFLINKLAGKEVVAVGGSLNSCKEQVTLSSNARYRRLDVNLYSN